MKLISKGELLDISYSKFYIFLNESRKHRDIHHLNLGTFYITHGNQPYHIEIYVVYQSKYNWFQKDLLRSQNQLRKKIEVLLENQQKETYAFNATLAKVKTNMKKIIEKKVEEHFFELQSKLPESRFYLLDLPKISQVKSIFFSLFIKDKGLQP